ncbi:hypothetical protein NM208_g3707 [Fusarium decemcellulare]|uniref:Uncharacterized protein n=1 Tax=Fusarium decemcellulare TaxID=57161 RepID=A0ACC1SNN3_9HYPO|nr:hypothetical protein NM208_g3707 [Fusarium decemcellulare]
MLQNSEQRQRQLQDTGHGAAIATESSAPNDDTTSTRASLVELVTSLRAQLNNVESRIEAYDHVIDNSAIMVSKSINSSEPLRSNGQSTNAPNRHGRPAQESHDSNVASPSFYGPTSPNYSMNLVQITLFERGYLTPSPRRPMLPSFNRDNAAPSSTSHWQPKRHCDRHQLLQFRSWLTIQEAKSAVSTYHEVVGELHPFVDSDRIKSQLEWWYSYDEGESSNRNNQQPDDDDLIILVLMLATAAQAQRDTLHAKMAPIMHSSFQHAVDAAVTSCTTSIKQVVIVLLLGCYYFSHDLPRPVLRVCGTAGRMLMKLGFHNSDVLNNVLKSEIQRQQVSILTCSVMILDRQWSAMTGLPANFPSATFSRMSGYLFGPIEDP